jgi:PTH1 family peptidyl-tRNA hydrolase
MLLVGLGNPGNNYASTRHNVGFMVLDQLARAAGASFRLQGKLHGELADLGQGDRRIRLLKPQTFMNESGRSIRACLDWYGWGIEQMLVVVDDMDLPLGKLRLRVRGSAGGHNGLLSTIEHLGSDEFARLRIGIGAPLGDQEQRKNRTVAHVLGSFSKGEQELLSEVLKEVCQGIELIQRQGIEKAGNRLNGFKATALDG